MFFLKYVSHFESDIEEKNSSCSADKYSAVTSL